MFPFLSFAFQSCIQFVDAALCLGAHKLSAEDALLLEMSKCPFNVPLAVALFVCKVESFMGLADNVLYAECFGFNTK